MSHAASPSAWGSIETAGERLPGKEHPPPRAAALPRTRRERLLLAGIVLLAASMYGWEAAHAEYHAFYAVAARSMTTGGRAFLFGALDPNASITIDKIPGFLWPQALSAMAFGFHPWSLALPQVLEGVVTVLALGSAVRRWIGPRAGLLAASATTPASSQRSRTVHGAPVAGLRTPDCFGTGSSTVSVASQADGDAACDIPRSLHQSRSDHCRE